MSPPPAPFVFTMNDVDLLIGTLERPSPLAVTMLESTISNEYGEPENCITVYKLQNNVWIIIIIRGLPLKQVLILK